MADLPNKNNVPDVLAALKEEFATSLNNVYINSLKKTYSFRDITVLEQKTFSKLTIDHDGQPDFLYDAQCALIQKLCTDPEFDVYKITEFDRLKIFFLIYQANFFNSTFTITCPHCNNSVDYTIDFEKLVKAIDDIEISDVTVEYIVKNRKYEFTINFPSVTRMADYKKYQAKMNKKNKVKHTDEQETGQTLIDLIDIIIKKLVITNLTTNNVITLVPEDMSYEEYSMYLETIPQNVIYSSDSPLIKVAQEKYDQLRNALPKSKCPSCGEDIELVEDIDGFFI